MMEKYGVETTTVESSEKISEEIKQYKIGKNTCGICGSDVDEISGFCEYCQKVPESIYARIEKSF